MGQKERIIRLIGNFLPSFFIATVPLFTASLLLRNLGWLIGNFIKAGDNDKFDFVGIFEQTKEAVLSVHWLIPLVLSLLFFFAVRFLFRGIKSKAILLTLKIVLFVFFMVVAVAFALMLTRVNGIRFCDLLGKLLPLIDKL